MHMAARLAQSLGFVDNDFTERQQLLLEQFDLPTHCDEQPEQLWQAMQLDKKVEHGRLRFVLPRRLGQVELVPGISGEQALQAMRS